MSLTAFIPEIWSARLLANLHKALVYGQEGIINRDYEGDVRYGNTVRINRIGAIAVGDYTPNTPIGEPQQLSGDQRTLVIDQANYFHFYVDDVDAAQMNVRLMDDAMREAAYALADVMDQFLAGKYVEAGNTIGDDTTPVQITKDTAYDIIVDAGIKLDQANVPRSNRFIVVPPAIYGVLLKSSLFVEAAKSGSTDTLRNGEVGTISGFKVLTSNNVPTVNGAFKVLAGHPMAITFASQIEKTEAYRPEKRFADAVKGLAVYGAKVIVPEALVCLTLTV
ncbi:hypothetical protein Desku_1117 [Desulfofundulus kuznetsovii DSM 6115]|uniref:P22 coat protein-protein 5 domain protein n=1 Tax=Desulfofundulus kuznetsovii (strain DSM 6115 / VKM B-1805 / 17) TaxID=760568 RepID=A0AAU8PG18_DESK7|nr:hypothetical protein Desku_1117 [Desulfofundulus kuznetsovii DSM 6115]